MSVLKHTGVCQAWEAKLTCNFKKKGLFDAVPLTVITRNTVKIDFFPLDLRTKKVIPSQSISIIDVRTAQDHVLAPRGSRDLISRSSHFFLADEEGPRGVVDRWDGPTGPGFGSHGTGMIAQLERARGHINVTLN